MIRRFSAALIGLALILPVFAVTSVSAHATGGLVVTVDDTWTDGAGDTHVSGTVTNHTNARRTNIAVTVFWELGTVDASESALAPVGNLAPHSSAAFQVVEEDTDVSAAGAPDTATATGNQTSTRPTGGLHVEFETLVGNVATINVTNDSATLAEDVVVSALRGGSTNGAAAESPAADLAAGANADFLVTFDAASTGGTVSSIVAESTSGLLRTSWDNFFGDLTTQSDTFRQAIAFMADEGITTGCGNANYCPKNPVTRAQMAVFLDRALALPDDNVPAHPFTDIGTQSADFQQAIQNVFAAGITQGCTATTYCPTQSVTRGQMSKFIVVGYGLAPIPGPGTFTDDNGHFSEPYNNRMAADGITSGCGTGKYCPFNAVLREQMAVFIFKAETP